MLTRIKNSVESKPDSPFAKKWQQIEKKQKRNATAKAKIEKLYQIFQDEILPEEQKVVELLAQETRHLMTFLSRKSFTQWQREELQSWIESNLETLAQHPFGDHELFTAVNREYGDHLAVEAKKFNSDVEFSSDDIAQMREMTNEMFQGAKKFTDEELLAFMRDPAIFQQAFRDFMEEMEDNLEESMEGDDSFFDDGEDFSDYYSNGEQHYQGEQQVKKQGNLKSLFNSSKLNKLYKILANKLHPDKEKNVHLKDEKSELMTTLVKAKKNKDAFTIISMFHQFVPESELTLFDGSDEELTEALITLLNEKSHQLDKENDDNKYRDGIKSMVWQKLNGRSKKATQENIDIHIKDLEDSHTRLNYYIHEVKTVKLLKEILSERYEQHHFNPFETGEFTLADLDELFR